MTTRNQTILLSIIALLVALGYAGTRLAIDTLSQLAITNQRLVLVEKQRVEKQSTPVVAKQANLEESKEKEEDVKTEAYPSGLVMYKEAPKVSTFTVGTSTFTVLHWSTGWEDSQSAVAVYYFSEKDAKEELVFTDVAGSCGQPFDYGVKEGMFYVHKNVNPCEGMSEDWNWWYDSQGKEISRSSSYSSTLGSNFSFQLPGKKPQSVELVTSRVCESIPVPDDIYQYPQKMDQKVMVSGVKIGSQFIPLRPAKEIQCWFMELNGPNFATPYTREELVGTRLELTLPTDQRIELDVRQPTKYSITRIEPKKNEE